MTCVVGLVDGGVLRLGADSNVESSVSRISRSAVDPKIFVSGPFAIGTCGSPRMRQILRFQFTPPPQGDKDAFEYMAVDFLDAVRASFKRAGFARVKDEQESGGTFLVGYRGTLYEIMSDYQINVQDAPYAAIGSGHVAALGSLHTTQGMTLAAQPRLERALLAAESVAVGVRGPFHYVTVGGDES